MDTLIIDIETKTLGTHSNRVLMVDKLQAEKTARAAGWSFTSDEITLTAFLAYQTLKRLHVLEETTGFEEFVNTELIDALVTSKPKEVQGAGAPLVSTGILP